LNQTHIGIVSKELGIEGFEMWKTRSRPKVLYFFQKKLLNQNQGFFQILQKVGNGTKSSLKNKNRLTLEEISKNPRNLHHLHHKRLVLFFLSFKIQAFFWCVELFYKAVSWSGITSTNYMLNF
jgi:hypothetical protein